MKKKILCLLLMIAALPLYAEDVIQVIPLKTTAGVVSGDKKTIEICLNNSSFDVANLQFDILLPTGMSLTGNKTFTTRIPRTVDDEEEPPVTEYDFDYQTAVQESGYTRFMFIPRGELRPIASGTGTILKLRYTTDASMAPGIYPILMEEILLSKTETEDITVAKAASYVIIGDDNPLTTDEEIDLSSLTGYIPSFVVDALNTDLATNSNLKSVDLSGATGLGAELDASALVTEAGDVVSFGRKFAASRWSTVCLPFALDVDQVAAIKAPGCEIEKLVEYDETNKSVTFEAVSTMEANTPYLIKCTSDYKPFADLTGVTVLDGQTPGSVTVGNMTMKGTYTKQTLNSDASKTYFGYQESDGALIRIGSNATIKPYRAFMELSGGSNARSLTIYHADGDVTVVGSIKADGPDAVATYYDLQGRKVDSLQFKHKIYVKQGKKFVK